MLGIFFAYSIILLFSIFKWFYTYFTIFLTYLLAYFALFSFYNFQALAMSITISVAARLLKNNNVINIILKHVSVKTLIRRSVKIILTPTTYVFYKILVGKTVSVV